jgi:hypothetical protein
LPFLAKLDLDASTDARQSRRFLPDRLDGVLVGKDRRFDVIVHNISETGFLAEFPSELRPGDTVRLQLARIGFVSARVVRRRGMGHGCQFLEPVPGNVIAETIAANTGQQPQAEPSPEEADGQGYRRRAARERLGMLVATVSILAAVTVLTGALIRILTT